MRNYRGIDVVYLNCASCHTGTVRDAPGSDPHVVPGMPANTFDLGAWGQFLTDVPLDQKFSEGTAVVGVIGAALYCLSYTAVLVNFLPLESVPVRVTVRVLPSADTTPRPLIVTLSPFLFVNARV